MMALKDDCPAGWRFPHRYATGTRAMLFTLPNLSGKNVISIAIDQLVARWLFGPLGDQRVHAVAWAVYSLFSVAYSAEPTDASRFRAKCTRKVRHGYAATFSIKNYRRNRIYRRSSIAGIGLLRWEKNGAECSAERYGYRGEFCSFDVAVMRVSKWLKLTNGNTADVKRWIANNRETGLSKSHSTLESPQRKLQPSIGLGNRRDE